ncbi:MAG: GcrA cell cycle regulator [Limimaricola cinnabarinus]|jgi:GcrA cell cycle regulator|uniref:GcrA cell cycle regulator n=1 Tax=Limimaricola cinnabarinus LL-001 TaxID=1337093 RepID=U2YI55_9RHOB|nr:GcrA family cell cycle regulator [Limimaricola cinnabarinus]GAD54331.1 gcrA cell cycle regulator [Limimaricola cinnabarinus LL-001]
MSWTDERVETLKKMWNEGQSASQIAKELGGVTRNAVIGKVHRLGLSNRTGVAPQPAPPAPQTAPSAPAQPTAARPEPAPAPQAKPEPKTEAEDEDDAPIPMSAARRAIIPAGQPLPPQPSANEISPEALAKVSEIEKGAKKLTLMELTEKTCKWPVGDPATDNFWFCGLPTQSGKPYCEAHVGVAFQPMSSRRDRRR